VFFFSPLVSVALAPHISHIRFFFFPTVFERTLGHLSDEELVDFLKKCKESLRPAGRCLQASSSTSSDLDPLELDDDPPNLQARADENNYADEDSVLAPPTFERDGGLIIIKENIFVSQSDPDGDNFLFDKEDSSLTRSAFLSLFSFFLFRRNLLTSLYPSFGWKYVGSDDGAFALHGSYAFLCAGLIRVS
jgi:hypothetical protein